MNRTRTVAEARILVRAGPDEVYRAFREPERLKAWYFDDATLDLAPGGRFAFKGIEGRVEAVITEVRDDGFEFAYEPPWWGTVRLEMAPEAKGTRVRVRHDGFEGREEWVQRFAWGWEAHLRNLKAFLEGRPPK